MIYTVLLISAGFVAVVIAAVLIVAAMKPDTMRIRREARIDARPERIFPLINDFRNWAAWSPWEKLDPDLKRTYSGSASGQGAVYEWAGNKKVGQGRMEIVESSPPTGITIKLDFLKPFEAHNVAEFALDAQGDSTNVAWEMRGPQPFMMKVMCVFMNMDKLIGKDFEAGLANLKAQCET